MAYSCDNCGKHTVFGNTQKHRRGVAGKRWKNRVTPTTRVFKPNLQSFTPAETGEQVRWCAKCIKRYKRDRSVKFSQI